MGSAAVVLTAGQHKVSHEANLLGNMSHRLTNRDFKGVAGIVTVNNLLSTYCHAESGVAWRRRAGLTNTLLLTTEMSCEQPKEIFSFITSRRKCSFMNFTLMPYESLLPDALGCQKHEYVQKTYIKICGRTVQEGLKQNFGQMTSDSGSPQAADCWQLGECSGEKLITLAWLVPCMWG